MASIRKGWRLLAVASAAALALALVTSAFAQAPPPGPHIFYGDAGSVSLDGEAVASGTVTATNQDGETVGSSSISDAGWEILVQSTDASSVTFSVDGSNASEAYAVEQFGMNAVTLDLTSPAGDGEEGEEGTEPEEPAVGPEEPEEPVVEPVKPETPSGLPNTGSGGLASTGSGFPLMPVALVVAALVALSGVAVTRRAGIGAR